MGIVISDEITGLLDRVPWDNIQNKVYDTSKAFAEFFNGLSKNNLLGYKIGDTLAEIINTGIVGLESLGENLDFTTLGEFLSAYSGQSLEEVTGLFEKAMNFGSLKLGDALTNALDMDETFLEEFRELETVEERVQMLLEKGEKVRGTYARWLETSAGKI